MINTGNIKSLMDTIVRQFHPPLSYKTYFLQALLNVTGPFTTMNQKLSGI